MNDSYASAPTKQWALPGVADHPLRTQLTNEIHARSAFVLHAPAQISHISLLTGEEAGAHDRQHLIELCRRFGTPEPTEDVNFWHMDFGMFRLNWERHTEFSSYTFIREHTFSAPFENPAIRQAPQDWVENLKGEVLVAVHLALESADQPPHSNQTLTPLFASDNIAGSELSGGAAIAWSDFRLQGDGFSRLLVRDVNLTPRQAGRVAQRLLEIETYRLMALLSLPLARSIANQVTQADEQLARLTNRMIQSQQSAVTSTDIDDEHTLFEQLSQLAAEIERLAASTNYRFSASRAYYSLVERRVKELREQRIQSRSTFQEFMQRRLAPAMRTCESVNERIEVLSGRISRAGNLLRTRVDIALEQQNQDLLESMNRRAEMQLRLQETVEGLSVVVLSYYLIGLLSYSLKAGKAAGWPVNPDLLSGLAVPVVLGGIWFGMRRLRSAFHQTS